MAVSPGYRTHVLEQMERVTPVASRSMFGGVGVYADGLFFALMDDDTTYLKVDDASRPSFEALGMGPFRPQGAEGPAMGYHELPAELLEDPERLRPWLETAIEVARRARRRS